MAVMPVTPREPREWTVDDLDALADDGWQYELLDGLLLVTPAPIMRHQLAAGRLYRAISAVCPPELVTLFAPFDWRPDRGTSLQPDLLVFGWADAQEACLVAAPVVVVEILSPSTRRKDLVFKRSKYEDAGVAHYWVVDPAEPSMTALELHEGRYVETGHARAGRELVIERPFRVAITPSDLVRSGAVSASWRSPPGGGDR